MRFLFALLLLSAPAAAQHGWPQMPGVQPCGMVTVPAKTPAGLDAHEFSGAAGTRDGLFVVTDQGWLVRLRPIFKRGKLLSVRVVDARPLRDERGKRLPWNDRDAEGLHLVEEDGKAELIVSFERRPRVERFRTNGKRIGGAKLAKEATEPTRYKNLNRAFEGLTFYNGHILTAPEQPGNGDGRTVPLFDEDGVVARYPLGLDSETSLVGLDALPSGHILALERTYHKAPHQQKAALYLVTLPKKRGKVAHKTVLAILDSQKGFSGIDNFEAVVALEDGRVLLLSDDNHSDKQRSLMLCLAIDRLVGLESILKDAKTK